MIMNETGVAFEKLYKEVFDEQGNVKACGRDRCKMLMQLAHKLDAGANFGDTNAGYMNIEAMKELHAKLIG